ncbi:MAG: ABC transporter ATP-binding protein [Acetivibrionales bacterium]|jgi:branched-chain amino acid transport system ATP-binding protein
MLYAENIEVRFGGLIAVNNVSIHINHNEIHAIIGPNGAGKSTFFNAISGLNPPTSGKIVFLGEDITGSTPNQVAAKGIGRTFQNIKLFSTMTVLDNVLVGCHMQVKSNIFHDMISTPLQRRDEKEKREYAINLLERVGLVEKKDMLAKNLPYGEQRKLEIVRSMASDPKLLMLDEPAAGMNPSETEELKQFIQKICNEGLTILLIEHDVKMVMSLANTITVLDHGTKIAEGDALTVRNDEKVIEAYLGKSYRRQA